MAAVNVVVNPRDMTDQLNLIAAQYRDLTGVADPVVLSGDGGQGNGGGDQDEQ